MRHFIITDPTIESLSFSIIESKEEIEIVSNIFIKNVSKEYMALGDFESGRIDENIQWKDNIKDRFINDYASPSDVNNYISIKNMNGEIIGFMIVGVNIEDKFSVLYDIFIDSKDRGNDYGTKTFHWLMRELKLLGIKRILLESGINNKRSHSFFKRLGFKEFAIEFIKEI